VRRLNKLITDYFSTQNKFIKESVLSKIVKTTESEFKNNSKIDEELADFCNGILLDIKISKIGYLDFNLEGKRMLKILTLGRNLLWTFKILIGIIKRAIKVSNTSLITNTRVTLNHQQKP